MRTHPKTYGPFPVVQPSHLQARAALTQEQRLNKLKQDARAQAAQLTIVAHKAADRRFTGEAITNFGAFA